MIYVIGSGLSGIATAVALVKRGFRPTILDAGLRVDTEVSELKARLASVEPDAWTPEDIARLKRTGPSAPSGIPQKLHFGSDFPYQDIDPSTTAHFRRASVLRSFAVGGFSNVWGAVIQALPHEELQNWPVDLQQLAPHHDAIRDLLCADGSIRPSAQGLQLHSDLNRHRGDLDREGIQFDFAKLAVRNLDGEAGKGCRHCGLCLYGCPYDSIFSASAQLARMVRQGYVFHDSEMLVDRISKTKSGVCIEGRSSTHGGLRSFEGRAVFVAAGVLESARIILNSAGGHSAPVRLQQSDIFTIPMLRYRSAPAIDRERIHTLSQIAVEINDRSICAHSVQLQLYGYNDLYLQILKRRLASLSIPLRPLLRAISERLMVAFGYLHSEISSPIWITRTATGNGRLRLEGRISSDGRRAARAVVNKLARTRRCFQAVPIPLQLRFDAPGGGHRSGGCFPMTRVPLGLETDTWGRIRELHGVHIVDSSVLPSIPAGPVSSTAMANAHRIASECPLGDE